MSKVSILDAAAQEAAEAAAWYDGQRPGLGSEFQRAIEAPFVLSVAVAESKDERLVIPDRAGREVIRNPDSAAASFELTAPVSPPPSPPSPTSPALR